MCLETSPLQSEELADWLFTQEQTSSLLHAISSSNCWLLDENILSCFQITQIKRDDIKFTGRKKWEKTPQFRKVSLLWYKWKKQLCFFLESFSIHLKVKTSSCSCSKASTKIDRKCNRVPTWTLPQCLLIPIQPARTLWCSVFC